MPDQQQATRTTDPNTGNLRVSMGTPGFSGAIVDLMRALASSYAPRSIVQRPQALQNGIAQNDGSNPPLGQQF